jgi:two-component system chemotaxis response regulator CheB
VKPTAPLSSAPPAGGAAAAAASREDPIRVMIVDDSSFIRGIVSRWVSEEPGLSVVASHPNGLRAANDVARSRPDIVILDIEMPEMDGLTALPLILARRPGTAVIMASTLTRRGAEISIRALTLGAADYVPKPDSNNGLAAASDFRHELITKIRSLAPAARHKDRERARMTVRPTPAPARATNTATPSAAPRAAAKFRPPSMSAVRALVIGSSTGGPQALTQLFSQAGPLLGSVPVLVAQHLPPTFTTILAEHIAKAAGRPAAEGVDGEIVRPGNIYVAPGGKHMTVAKSAGATVIRLSDGPPVNFCKPAVDPLFRSAASVYGSATLAVVLTGMGSDGAKGATQIADAGGSVFAQNEASSVVWGMPGAAFEAGACSEVLPLTEIGPRLVRRITGGRG